LVIKLNIKYSIMITASVPSVGNLNIWTAARDDGANEGTYILSGRHNRG
jgi:hypothetical protein